MLSVPVTRPIVAMSIKTFVPISLIVVCAGLVFFVRPRYVEGRIGLGITALLTLVALQLASGSSLPDVDYLMMLDKIYLLAYLFIIIALARVVATSWHGNDDSAEKAISRTDRIWAAALLAGYFAANIAAGRRSPDGSCWRPRKGLANVWANLISIAADWRRSAVDQERLSHDASKSRIPHLYAWSRRMLVVAADARRRRGRHGVAILPGPRTRL